MQNLLIMFKAVLYGICGFTFDGSNCSELLLCVTCIACARTRELTELLNQPIGSIYYLKLALMDSVGELIWATLYTCLCVKI